MDERQLRAFLSIARIGRMDLAAQELGYSQPAISYQIKRLEQWLGFKVFTRDSTGARLTREGQMILPSVRAAVMLIDGIREVGPCRNGHRISEAAAGQPLHAVVD